MVQRLQPIPKNLKPLCPFPQDLLLPISSEVSSPLSPPIGCQKYPLGPVSHTWKLRRQNFADNTSGMLVHDINLSCCLSDFWKLKINSFVGKGSHVPKVTDCIYQTKGVETFDQLVKRFLKSQTRLDCSLNARLQFKLWTLPVISRVTIC